MATKPEPGTPTHMFEPFQYSFMIYGMVAVVLGGALCGGIGVFIVLKRMAYIGHGLAHGVLGGVAVSFALSINVFIGATAWAFLSAQLIALTTKKRKIAYDAAIGVITTASFAFGIVLISTKGFFRNPEAGLFGSILGVTATDLAVVVAVTILVAVIIFVGYKYFLFTTFDGDVARFYGIRTGWVEALFSLVLAGTIVALFEVMGVLLIAGATVIPPASARLLTDSFHRMLLFSVLIGAVCGFLGFYLSYFLDAPSGAMVVLLEAGVFGLAMTYSNLRSRLGIRRGSVGKESSASLGAGISPLRQPVETEGD